MKILTLNLGSTSSKVALFEDENCVLVETLRHSTSECNGTIEEQMTFRLNVIEKFIKDHQIEGIEAIASRGGLLKPIEGGTYLVNQLMVDDLKSSKFGDHASNLCTMLAFELGKELKCEAYITDPVVVDELADVARVTGLKDIKRRSIFHALNQKAVAHNYADSAGKRYEELNLIVAHMGGGITVGTHTGGKVTDVNDGLIGEGPFSPERAGSLPTGLLVQKVLDEGLDKKTVIKLLTKESGLVSHFNTSNALEIENRMKDGDDEAKLVLDAMCYQIAKSIAAQSVFTKGKVDQILLTGGLAYSDYIVQNISERVNFIAGITVYPGEKEMDALTQGVLRIKRHEEPVKEYI